MYLSKNQEAQICEEDSEDEAVIETVRRDEKRSRTDLKAHVDAYDYEESCHIPR